MAYAAEYDAIVVGAGFSGISALYRLRKDGLRAHIFEAGSDFGGVWYWNRYPGARVDSETPFYQLNIPEVYNTWSFSQRFPDHYELRKYMAHVDETLKLRKDVSFNSKVCSCTWDKEAAQWTVKTENGLEARAKYLLLGTGLLHKTHSPEWPGKEAYKGIICHSGAWPENTDLTGKRVAVVGAGATSIQIVQELAKTASHLSVLVRRPSYCLPLGQRAWTEAEQMSWRGYFSTLFAAGRRSGSGFPTTRQAVGVQDVSEEEREKHFENIWRGGSFQFIGRNYNNLFTDKEANKIIYDFWKRKVRERLTDPQKQKIMAPDNMPYYFATKRNPLEQDYYESLNQDNVEIVDLNANPIESFTEDGLRLGGEDTERKYDAVVCATGFDTYTGTITNMGLMSKDGKDIKDIWADGVRTYLGVMTSGFPNMFNMYSPQAPTPISNGPSVIECQRDFICDIINRLQASNAASIEPLPQAEAEWKAKVNAAAEETLFPYTNSWWNTANVPGKKAENQTFVMGIGTYDSICRETLDGWKGFDVVSGTAAGSANGTAVEANRRASRL